MIVNEDECVEFSCWYLSKRLEYEEATSKFYERERRKNSAQCKKILERQNLILLQWLGAATQESHEKIKVDIVTAMVGSDNKKEYRPLKVQF